MFISCKAYIQISPKYTFRKVVSISLINFHLLTNPLKYKHPQSNLQQNSNHTHHHIFKSAIGTSDFNFRSLLIGRLLIQAMLSVYPHVASLSVCFLQIKQYTTSKHIYPFVSNNVSSLGDN